MNLRQLVATMLTTAAAATSIAIAPAQAQFYGYSNGWRQPIQSGPVIRPTQSNEVFRTNYPVMNDINLRQPRRVNNPGGFGHSSGSYFGW